MRRRPILVAALVALVTAGVAPSPSRAETTTVPPGTWYTLTFVDRIESGTSYAIAPKGDVLFAGLGYRLLALDISDPTQPHRIASIDLGGAGDIVLQGDLAYVASGTGLQILDVSDPTQPVMVGTEASDISGVAVAGTLAVVCGFNTVGVVDVSDPAAPFVLGSVPLLGVLPRRLAISGPYAYVVDWHPGELRIIDISNPAAPVQVSEISACTNGFGLELDGNRAYVSTDCHPLSIIDIGNPAAPSVLGSAPGSYWEGYGLAVRNDIAYVLNDNYDLRVFDVSDPAGIVQVGNVDGRGGYDLALQGDYLYTADIPPTFRIFDVSNPAAPIQVGVFERLYDPAAVQAVGGFLYVGEYFEGLRVLDVSDPHAPEFLADIGYYWAPTSFHIRGTELFIGTNDFVMDGTGAGFVICDISDPASPQILSERIGYDIVVDVSADEQYLYAIGYSMEYGDGLSIYDVTDPASPVFVSVLEFPRWVVRMEVRHDVAYVAAREDGLRVVDVSNPASPEVIAVWGQGSGVADVVLSGPYAFVLDPDSGLTVLSVVRPDTPTPVAQLSLPGSPDYLTQSGDYLFASGYSSPVLSVVGISDPTAPVEVAQYTTDGIRRVTVLDTLVIGVTPGLDDVEILGAGFLRETEVAVHDATPAPLALRAYPNPFGTAATIAFDLPEAMEAEVTVFDAAGRAVRRLEHRGYEFGTNRLEWDGRDDAGRRVASGVYFVRVRAEVGSVSR
ncbi:MAG: T9SS type A sorting domain-containing protein, partial [Candidatus Krumholzibacteria bacterium]|nr:T9SS type A sorting domain-containing protein [Candidatus Krumholzibacteria bacterium]